MKHIFPISRWATVPVVACLLLLAAEVHGQEWMTWPSTYTHEPDQGLPIDQYAQAEKPIVRHSPGYQRSGYRHYRSSLQAGQGSDNLHVVEQWGRDVVPYEQWRFPYRPYGVPYDMWGPPTPYGLFNGVFPYPSGYGNVPQYPQTQHPHRAGPLPGSPAAPAHPLPLGAAGTFPRVPGYGNGYGYGGSNGFPLTPPYAGQPWYDGNYPEAAPLDQWTDRQFYYKPRRDSNPPQAPPAMPRARRAR